MARVLKARGTGQAGMLYDFLTREKMRMKCFVRMKMEGLYRDVSPQLICQGTEGRLFADTGP